MPQMINVLITSIGRQTDLAAAFREVLQGKGKVLAADADETAPGLAAADKALISPSWRSDDYIAWLLDVCSDHCVRMLLSLHETDLSILEAHREQFEAEGVAMLGSPRLPVDVVIDKFQMSRQLSKFGVATPPTYLAQNVVSGEAMIEDGPIIVKPRTGRGSSGLESLSSTKELRPLLEFRTDESHIVQPQIKGQEYGMDVVNDFDGQFRGALVRRKLRMRNGETDRAETIHDDTFVRIAQKVARCTRHRGVFDIDLMVGQDGPLIIDINPRFGGGYMFNHIAGANAPAALVNWLNGTDQSTDLLKYEAGVVSQRLSPVRRVSFSK